jgi:hypothetical protein
MAYLLAVVGIVVFVAAMLGQPPTGPLGIAGSGPSLSHVTLLTE